MKLSAKVFEGPAEESALQSLRSILPESTPADYFEFLRKHDGAEFCFTDVDWARDGYDSIRVFSVEEVIEMQKQDWLPKSLPKLLAIGTDSGGQLLAYDMRKSEPWPVVMYSPGSADHLAFTPVVDSVSQLLTKYEDKTA